jgi:hypothetical protein
MGISISTPPIALGDRAMLVRLGESIDEANFLKVQSLLRHLDDDPHPAMIECVPAFASLTIHYDPLRATFEELCWHVQSALDHLDPTSALAKRGFGIRRSTAWAIDRGSDCHPFECRISRVHDRLCPRLSLFGWRSRTHSNTASSDTAAEGTSWISWFGR